MDNLVAIAIIVIKSNSCVGTYYISYIKHVDLEKRMFQFRIYVLFNALGGRRYACSMPLFISQLQYVIFIVMTCLISVCSCVGVYIPYNIPINIS